MFSYVVLSPEAEYAKKVINRRHVLALESQKGLKMGMFTVAPLSRMWHTHVPVGTYYKLCYTPVGALVKVLTVDFQAFPRYCNLKTKKW